MNFGGGYEYTRTVSIVYNTCNTVLNSILCLSGNLYSHFDHQKKSNFFKGYRY